MQTALKSFTAIYKDNLALSVDVLKEVSAITPKVFDVWLKTDPFLNLWLKGFQLMYLRNALIWPFCRKGWMKKTHTPNWDILPIVR